jgi:hypothetical protein
MKLTKEEFCDLFEIACQGQLASAFYRTQTEPNQEQWDMLTGRREINIRAIAEVSFATCLQFNLNMSAIPSGDAKEN